MGGGKGKAVVKQTTKAPRLATGKRRAGGAAMTRAGGRTKYVIDLAQPVEDRVLDSEGLKNFLSKRLKVDGKTNNLKEHVVITNDRTKVNISVDIALSKRYLKYLTKKYLKAQQLRDFLRVIANRENSYELRYFQMNEENSEDK